MTNGEKIIAILKPRKDQIRIYDNWVEIEIQKLGINFSCELDWWNTECNEPTTKNDLGIDCINRQAAITFVCKNIKEILKDTTPLEVKLSDDYIYENVAKIMRNPKVLPSVTPQKPALYKIKAEIEEAQTYDGIYIDRAYVLEIIDKYKTESEKNKLC